MAGTIRTEQDLRAAVETKRSLDSPPYWYYAGSFASGTAVATYVNTPQAQTTGQVVCSGNSGGPFDVWIYVE